MDGTSGKGSLTPQSTLSNYRLGKTLGIGAFGKVKVAEHTLTGVKVAIKILDRRSINDSAAEKVRREINIMRLLSHPHIVRLYEVIETRSAIYVIMEYMNSGELFDYITENGRLEEDEARHFFQQIISGVESCHLHMVVHRDLKPENLLLDLKGNVKIADFGLGNVMQDGHFLKTSCGSPNYAAPEVISARLYAGPEVDVWSCGVILYALLCGSLPFDDDNLSGLYAKIKNGTYTYPNYLSLGACDLITRMLVVDPVNRISIPEIHKHAWFRKHLPQYIAACSINTLHCARKAPDCTDRRETYVRPVFPVQGKWALGFKSCASPNETMRDVLTILKSLNVQWKKIGPYNMKCLRKPAVQSYPMPLSIPRLTLIDDIKFQNVPVRSNKESFSLCDAVKFEIQLYKASAESYLLDWQRICGPPFLFIELCVAFQACVIA